MTERIAISWPDESPFRDGARDRIRFLAVSDEVDPALDSDRTRAGMQPVDAVIGCGDLEPDYLGFLADGLGAPLVYVRGNHDVGRGWKEGEHLAPDALPDGRVHVERGVALLPFSGAPEYAPHGRPNREQQVSGWAMWRRTLGAWPRAARRRPLIVVTHAAPRGLNDAADPAHRGFTAFRWLLDRLQPPLWLHGHTALVRRGLDGRTVRQGRTLLVNVTGSVLVDLLPPGTSP